MKITNIFKKKSMENNLYTFSKNSWHVKFFTWIYGTNPTKVFNTMCPYFWSYVATIIFLPFILIIKLFGKTGTTCLGKLESYKRNEKEDSIRALIKRCEEVSSDKEAYDIVKSKCWYYYKWYLDYQVELTMEIKYRKHNSYLDEVKRHKKAFNLKREQKIIKFKESSIFTYIAYSVTIGLISILGYVFYFIFSLIEFQSVDWVFVGYMVKNILKLLSIVALLFVTIKYLLIPFFNYLKCIKLPKCRLCRLGLGKYLLAPFKFIGKGILIICDMIYMTYKKACPRITWKNEE